MTAEKVVRLKKRPAKRPKVRTVHVLLDDGDFAGWEATAKADFPASWLTSLDTKDVGTLTTFLERIILDHNMPNSDDEVAERMADVDPYWGLVAIANGLIAAMERLPNR